MKPLPSNRWSQLCRSAQIDPEAPLLVALSGGADSVLLLRLCAAARPRPRVVAVHVDHGLRGAEARLDAAFCADLCRELEVPLRLRRVDLSDARGSLEARAREARYEVLAEEARRHCVDTVATGHHSDDALETLLMRWLRGTELGGLWGMHANAPLPGSGGDLRLVRPLISLRREEVRHLLRGAGHPWREDSTNASPRFTRNRVRRELLPLVEEVCGPESVEHLFAFGRAVEELEAHCAAWTADLSWEPPVHSAACRSERQEHLGGSLPRGHLVRLPLPLRRRAVCRLLTEGTGRAPGRKLLDGLMRDLSLGRTRRTSLPGGWSLQLRSDRLHLEPSEAALRGRRVRQLELPFDLGPPAAVRLGVPGSVTLGDGRRIQAELCDAPPGADVPQGPATVELAADDLPAELTVRPLRPGDRFHALGAPGSKKLSRFLADAGVPRGERPRIPLVFAGDELIWVAGVRPSESRRVARPGGRRLRLRLVGGAEPRSGPESPDRSRHVAGL